MIQVASFDIFDTCLTRTVAYPTDLFLELGELARTRNFTTLSPATFQAHRIAAESASRKLAPSSEVTLGDIYRQLGSDFGLSPQAAEEIMSAELRIEEQALQPVAETRQRIARAREQGCRIAFLSDMYLPASFLERLLRKHGFLADGDTLHVSGDVKLNKGSGRLYQHARENFQDTVGTWTHLGDHPTSDVKAPLSLGIAAEHFTSGLLNRYERRICPRKHLAEPSKSRLAAAMRIGRLSKPEGLSRHEQVIWDSGADLAGPLFYGYVRWILNEAARQRLPRLYFVARDGQVLHQIAQVIQTQFPAPLDCRYLYGSRHAWVPASLREVDDSHLKWILSPTAALTVRQVFQRIEIDPKQHLALLESSGFSRDEWDRAIRESEFPTLEQALRSPALSAEIKSVCEIRRKRLLEYLSREGLFEQEAAGIIDLGWKGSLRQALSQICEQSPYPVRPQITGFFFALVHSPHLGKKGFSAYVNTLCPAALGSFQFYQQLLEAFAVADHGQTRDYQNGEPVLAHPDNPAVSKWGLDALRGGMLAFCRAYAPLDHQADCDDQAYLKATLSVMELFYENPSLDEVQAWGTFPFSDQQVENELETLLPAWNRHQTVKALLSKDGRKKLWWPTALGKRESMPSLHLYYQLQKLWRTRLKPKRK